MVSLVCVFACCAPTTSNFLPDQKSLAIAQQVHVHDIRVVDQHQYQLVVDVRRGDEEEMNQQEAKQVLLDHRGTTLGDGGGRCRGGGGGVAREGPCPVEFLQQAFLLEEARVQPPRERFAVPGNLRAAI